MLKIFPVKTYLVVKENCFIDLFCSIMTPCDTIFAAASMCVVCGSAKYPVDIHLLTIME